MTWRIKADCELKEDCSLPFRYLVNGKEGSRKTFCYVEDQKKGVSDSYPLADRDGKVLVERAWIFQRDHSAEAQDFEVSFEVIDGIPTLKVSELDETLTEPLQEVFLPIPLEFLEYSDPEVDHRDVLLQAFYKRELSGEIESLKHSEHVLNFVLNPHHDAHKAIDFIRKHGVKESSDTFKRSEAALEALVAKEAEIRDQVTQEAMLSLHKELDFFFKKEIKKLHKNHGHARGALHKLEMSERSVLLLEWKLVQHQESEKTLRKEILHRRLAIGCYTCGRLATPNKQ